MKSWTRGTPDCDEGMELEFGAEDNVNHPSNAVEDFCLSSAGVLGNQMNASDVRKPSSEGCEGIGGLTAPEQNIFMYFQMD